MSQQIDLGGVVQTSLKPGTIPNQSPGRKYTYSRSSSETVIAKPGEQRITIPITTQTPIISTQSTIQLPSSSSASTVKEHSLVLPACSSNSGPLLCQLDDNSYVLIEGLDQLITTTTSANKATTNTATSAIAPFPIQRIGESSVPVTSSAVTGQTKTALTLSTSTVKPTSKVATGSQIPTTKTPANPAQNTNRGTVILLSNSSITSKAKTLTKEAPIPSTLATKTVVGPAQNSNTTNSPPKQFTNIISPNSVSNNAPFKYILIPQSKPIAGTTQARPLNTNQSVAMNSGVKTFTFNPTSSGPMQSFQLPVGTTLVPTSKTLSTKPTPTKVSSPVIGSSKINIVVPKSPKIISTPKIQVPQFESTKSDLTTTISSDRDEAPRSPSPSLETHGTKTLITYSKRTPTTVLKPSGLQEAISSTSPPTNTDNDSTIDMSHDQPKTVAQNNVSSSSVQDKKISSIQGRRRKAAPENQTDSATKKKKESQNNISSSSATGLAKESDGGARVRKVIASRNIQPSDKAVLNTAVGELKKLIARRELLLKQLNSSCVSLGKVEYKLTISGTPINVQEMYSRISSFQTSLEEDLKRLDWAVNAMHKLYSELAPKDEMRTTEEILKDLMGPEAADPKVAYDHIKIAATKPHTARSQPKPRSPEKPAKKVYYQGEAGCPTLPLEDRSIPEKDPSDGKYHCELCPKVFLKQISLAKHLEFDHPVSLGLEKKLSSECQRSPKLPHPCVDCDKSFYSNIMLLIHRANEHDALDSYELSRESRTQVRKPPVKSSNSPDNFDDPGFKSTNETKVAAKTNNNNSNNNNNKTRSRRPAKTKKKTRLTVNTKVVVKEADLLSGADLASPGHSRSSSRESNKRSSWTDVDLFDADIPIECSKDNPIIPLKPLTAALIASYTNKPPKKEK